MYGTIGKLRALPGTQAAIGTILGTRAGEIPGLRFEYLFQSDADPRNLTLVVGFDSEAAYHANANSQSQHESYLAWRELLEADPEWSDGEIMQSRTI